MVENIDISPKKIPSLQIYQDSSKTYYFQLRDEFEQLIDITEATVTFEVFLEKAGINEAVVITSTGQVTNGEKGMFYVSLTDLNSNVDNLIYKYRIKFSYNTNDTLIIGDGLFDVVGDEESNISRIKKKYGFVYTYEVMADAWSYAKSSILNKGFYKTVIITNQKSDEFLLDNYMGDASLDGVVDENDITIREYQENSPYTINDLTNNIDSLVVDHPNGFSILTMDNTYPTDSTYTLEITYYRALDTYSQIKSSVVLLEELFFIQYLFMTLEPYKLQQGMTTKTINGVDITFDQNAIHEYQKKLQNQINALVLNIRGLGFDSDDTSVLLEKRYKRGLDSYRRWVR